MSAEFLEKSCNMILNSVRNSCLNFSIQETPFSLYLTVRKSMARNKSLQDDESNEQTLDVKNLSETILKEEIKTLKIKLNEAEDFNLRLQHECEEAVNESEKCNKEMKMLETKVFSLKDDKIKLEDELESSEKSWKSLTKQVKEKDKTIHDLRKENQIISENFAQIKTQFANLTATVQKEKKKEEKNMKKKESKEFLENLKANSQEGNFQCNLCDVTCESSSELQSHVRFCHMKSSSMQTQEKQMEDKKLQICGKVLTSDKAVQSKEEIPIKEKYDNYPCFYCDKKIESEGHLLEHRVKCHGVSTNPSLFWLPIRPPDSWKRIHEDIAD